MSWPGSAFACCGRASVWPDMCQTLLKHFPGREVCGRVVALAHCSGTSDGWLVQAIIDSFRDVEMGGRVYACMVGSAPSAPEVVHFLRTALVAPILESFGSTETGEDFPAVTA